jgi:hypothetical protein
MTLSQLLDALSAKSLSAEVKVRLVDHDDGFHFAPVYEVLEDEGGIVISGVPPNVAREFNLD